MNKKIKTPGTNIAPISSSADSGKPGRRLRVREILFANISPPAAPGYTNALESSTAGINLNAPAEVRSR